MNKKISAAEEFEEIYFGTGKPPVRVREIMEDAERKAQEILLRGEDIFINLNEMDAEKSVESNAPHRC